MRIRIDLKILILLLIFYFTNQVQSYLIIMFFCLIHEFAHGITGMILKMKIEKIEIMPLGLSVSFFMNYNDKKRILKEIIVALAGPIASIALAIVYSNFKIQNAVYANTLIFIFNLLPIFPLDGGRILKGILELKLGLIKAENIIEKISYITILILTIISSIAVYYYKNIAIFLICIFLWIIALQEKNDKSLAIFSGK